MTRQGNEQNGLGRICELTCRALVWGRGALQIPPLRYPEFLSRLMALANFMRLSLMKAAHADLFGAMCRKSGSPIFFGPGTPWRTWGTRPEP